MSADQGDLFAQFGRQAAATGRDTMARARAARLAADEAIARVAEHADQAWADRVLQWVRDLPPVRQFTSDDVWDASTSWAVATHEPRALGAVLRQARRLGLAVPVTPARFVNSRRSECHARPVRLWIRMPAAPECTWPTEPCPVHGRHGGPPA